MLGARASRISSSSSRDPAPPSTSSADRRKAAVLTHEQLLGRWKSTVLKVLIVLNVFDHKNRVMAALTKPVYHRILGEVKSKDARNHESDKIVITRVVNGEIMGKLLEDSEKGMATTQPMMCNHHKLKRRGNKWSKWFVCEDCLQRWERTEMPSQSSIPSSTDLMLFGHHAGLTYEEVKSKHPQYVNWVKLTAASEDPSSTMLMRFAQYIATEEQREAKSKGTASTTPPTRARPASEMEEKLVPMTDSDHGFETVGR